MKKYTKLVFLLSLLLVEKAFGAAPTWSVNPASFQYNMTMVAVASINCVELQSASNRIGVFVGNQCRGTAFTSQVVGGRFTASLFIYSNVVQGEAMSFKVYNASQDSVYDIPNTVSFQQNASFGTSTVPYVLLNNNAPSQVNLSTSAFNENLAINSVVGLLSAIDSDAGESFTYSLVAGNGSTDNFRFNISGSQLRVSSLVNFEQVPQCSIRLRATDLRGCWVERSLVLQVTDLNEAPFAIFINDSAVNENMASNTAIGTFSGADPDASDVLIFSLASGAGDADNNSFLIVGNTLRTAASFNFESKSTYSIRVRVRDGVNNIFERAIQVLVRDVNDAPTSMLINGSASATSFPENRGIGTLVALLSTVDEDAGASFTYSFVSNGGNDNSNFQIVGNQIRSNVLFDFETRQNFSLFIQSSDGNGGTISRQFLLTVIDSNDAPTAIGLSGNTVFENQVAGTFVAKLSTSDPDAAQTSFTYALVSGAGSGGNSQFFLRNDSLFTNASFNFEVLNNYSIRLRTTDPNGASFQQSFTIQILDANDAPTDVTLSAQLIAENLPSGTAVGSLGAIDQDPANTFTYQLIAGVGATDNASFSIAGNSLRSNVVFDFEQKSSYSLRVRANDGNGGTFEKVFNVTIADANDAPTNINLSANAVKENATLNTLVGNLSAIDADAGNSFTYSFDAVTGNDNSLFVLSGSSLRTASVFNYEAKSVYFVYISCNDGNGGVFSKQFQININDSNDVPSELVLSSPTISENRPTGSFIGSFITTDQDASGIYSYSLVSGLGSTDNAFFQVRNDSLLSAQLLDFEVKNTYNIRARVTDGGQMLERTFTLRVINDNDPPTDIQLSNNLLNENLASGAVVGTFTSLDPDTGSVFSYALVVGTGATHNSLFSITGNQLRTNAILNYEQLKNLSIRVLTSDGSGGTFTKVFTIQILDVNDNPTQINLSNLLVRENLAANSLVGSLTTIDEDSASSFTYSLINPSTNDNNRFAIIGNQLRTNFVFDFETKNNYIIQVQTNDGRGGVFDRQFIVQITDTNDAPTTLSLSNPSLDENSAIGTFIGTLSTLDPDVTGSHTYSFVAGTGASSNAQFQIRNDSLFSLSLQDFEANPNRSIRVRSTDAGGLFTEQQFNIQILDKNDAPTGINISAASLKENLSSGFIVGNLNALDQDIQNSFTYTLVSGVGSTDNLTFNINGNALRTNTSFNYEAKSSYSIRVRANDGRGGSFEETFMISVLDSNDLPTDIQLSNNNIAENRQAGALVSVLTTSDQDLVENFSYTFFNGSSNNNDQFILVNNQLRTAEVFNFESKNFYIIYLTATDAAGASVVKQFVINITDSVDAPTDINLSNNQIEENQGVNAFVGVLSTTDPDQFSGFTYSFIGGLGASDNALFTISNDSLYTKNNLDFELRATYSIRIRTFDATGAFFDKPFSLQVINVNDAPTNVLLSNNTLLENEPAQTLIGTFTTTDADQPETFTYSFTSGSGDNDNSSFEILQDKVYAKMNANFEAKSLYTFRIKTEDKDGLSFEKSFVVTILDKAEAPTANSDTFEISESTSISASVGTVTYSSPDAAASINFFLVENSESMPFAIDSKTGVITLKAPLDYELKQAHQLTVIVNDSRNTSLSSEASILVKVQDIIETDLALPANNLMSPNGDGMNDAFVINNVDLYPEYALTIYNQSGMEVYSILREYKNNWTGTFNDTLLPTGVYYYIFTNGTNTFKGSINLTR